MDDVVQAFLESKDVKKALNQSQSALAAITVLKKVIAPGSGAGHAFDAAE